MVDKEMYILMEINYLKENNRSVDDNNIDLFPFDWYKIDNYKLKTEILYEAIKKKVKVIDTDGYNKLSCIESLD